ncbi:hypothetical protein [Curtobacterium sp. ISL-83]|uniref:hypothetical protein n=1 Tax=Curtobacterium sp. ISL-83 TaxID=2819145 RepID=UPI001BEB8F56|nr:hypothetical protein [Curtobacterium sp. ISL-83]MBT2504054.1 hypothetical protein [Curtobacterium sp. ISL-83]
MATPTATWSRVTGVGPASGIVSVGVIVGVVTRGAVLGDLTIDLGSMHGVASQAKQADAAFAAERPLSAADAGVFGSDAVAGAFAASAAAHDAAITSLGADAVTLASYVEEAASTMIDTDSALARKTR